MKHLRMYRPLSMSVIAVVLAMSACGPMSPEAAADRCEERARAAASPLREVGIGVNSQRGVIANAEIELTSDFLQGRDPQVVYEQCVRQLTGQGPIRPLRL